MTRTVRLESLTYVGKRERQPIRQGRLFCLIVSFSFNLYTGRCIHMASFDASKEEMQALSRQSEAAQRASAALTSALNRARGVRLCLVVAAVLLIAVICFKF